MYVIVLSIPSNNKKLKLTPKAESQKILNVQDPQRLRQPIHQHQMGPPKIRFKSRKPLPILRPPKKFHLFRKRHNRLGERAALQATIQSLVQFNSQKREPQTQNPNGSKLLPTLNVE